MSEHIDPTELDQLLAADFADTAAVFALLEHPASERTLDWLANDGATDTASELYERQLTDARTRFETAFAFSLANSKTKKDGSLTSLQPYEATDDDGTIQSVQLLQLSTDNAPDPYTLYKVFTEHVHVDEEADTRTEQRSEFWYISGSQYKHIPNGLEHKRTYVIVRPAKGGTGSLNYIQDETPELSQLNRLTRLAQQSPAHQTQKQGLGHTILGFITRKKNGDT